MKSPIGMPLRAVIPAAVILAWALAACGGGHKAKAPEDDAAATDPAMMEARSDYRFYCAACHGNDGRGAKNLFPPLRGSRWLNGDPAVPIRVVLHGLSGAITVEGGEFMNQMPPLGARLPDAKIAEILTYVRASWGNTGGPVTAEMVKEVRDGTQDRNRPFSPEDLKNLSSQ